MLAIMLRLGPEIDISEYALAAIALILIAATAVLWLRSYLRSRHIGWLLLAVGLIVDALGNLAVSSYLWACLGGFSIFAGSLLLCRDLGKARSIVRSEDAK